MFPSLYLLASVTLVFAAQWKRDKIPNGHSVPDPCHSGKLWQPVGHLVSNAVLSTKNNTNAFGQAFHDVKNVWTKPFCHADSDGDGTSNGEELGDPHCTWTEGGTPEGNATGHPGINEKTLDCSGIIG